MTFLTSKRVVNDDTFGISELLDIISFLINIPLIIQIFSVSLVGSSQISSSLCLDVLCIILVSIIINVYK